ncbi:hypothetical protein JHK82_015854 [Glycine max]|nr:hypothetical protein JHK86_015881 [Glycine max]KAG5148973.1 hypothetical protein JHK82_015854 [Glycine max]
MAAFRWKSFEENKDHPELPFSGGLFARYAIVVLYSPDTYSKDQPGDLANSMTENSQGTSFQEKG